MKDILLLLHCSKAAALAERLCVHLNQSHFTLPSSEVPSVSYDIDISNMTTFKNSVKLLSKILFLITNVDTRKYVNCVNKLLRLKSLHNKFYLLCCNTDGKHITMPDGSYYRCSTKDDTICDSSNKLLTKASGT